MMALEITTQRLLNQKLSHPNFKTPSEVVQWLGAVQAQDYAGAKWALGQRCISTTDSAIDQAFNEGKILRTHVMRPTWHFVTPDVIRWLLKLTASRVHAASAYMYRSLELDSALFKRSHAILEKALRDGKHLTRVELTFALKQAGISVGDQLRFTYMIGSAETDGLVCSGRRRGKQFTYALLEERVPPAKALTRDEALAGITQRYFTSHGPATMQDFVWWSGLTMTDAKNGIELVKSQLTNEELDGHTYWFDKSLSPQKENAATAHLLPNYDEYIVGYTDRSAIYDGSHNAKLDARGNVLFQNTIMLNGQVRGTWKRTLKKNEAVIELTLFTKATKAENHAIVDAVGTYGRFIELPVSIIHKEHPHEQGKTRSL